VVFDELMYFFFSSRRRHTRWPRDWSSDVCSSDLDGRLFSLEEPTGTREETVGSRIAARYDNPEERFARREIGKRMADSIRQLAPELRHVCLLRDVLEYSKIGRAHV